MGARGEEGERTVRAMNMGKLVANEVIIVPMLALQPKKICQVRPYQSSSR